MELDIDFTKERSKIPLYVCLGLTFLFFCISTPCLALIEELSCNYIEFLQGFYIEELGLTSEFISEFSNWLGFFLFDFWLVAYLVLIDQKYFALVQVIGTRFKGSVSQILKIVLMDGRPAWSCSESLLNYCRPSYGLTATHVWEATVCYISIIYFFFIHNGFFNKRRDKWRIQALKYAGISVCIFMIWLTHQTRLILGAHNLYQDIYAVLLGCVNFYTLYYYFYPWAMDPKRRFEFKNIWRFQVLLFIGLTLAVWSIYAVSLTYRVLPDGALESLMTACGYESVEEVENEFVNFDMSDATNFYASWLMLWLLPLKHRLPPGRFLYWSTIGLPLFLLCTYLVINHWPLFWLEWDSPFHFAIDYLNGVLWVAGLETIPFLYLYTTHRIETKMRAAKSAI